MIELYLPSLTLLIGNGYNFYGIGRISLQNVQALTEEGIQIRDTESFCNVRRMNSRNADALENYIRYQSGCY